MALYHASCVTFMDKGVLILGSSGSGKSDLALRLIDAGGVLVSDDYVDITATNNHVIARPAPNIEGLIEVRGVGLVKCEFVQKTDIHLVLELTDRGDIDRLPQSHYFEHEAVRVPSFKFDAFEVSAIAKIKMMLKQ